MRLMIILGFLLVAGCTTKTDRKIVTAEVEPAPVSVWSKGAMASIANPYATQAAVMMLKKGGHAVDAAIAAHAVLGLVEPQSSGLF